jgi:uncharacterized protein YcfJ
MNKSLLIGVIVGVGVAAGVGALGLALKGHQEPQTQALTTEQPAAPTGDTAQLDTSSPETPASPAPDQAQMADSAAAASPPPVAPPVEAPAEPKYVRVVSVEPQNRTVTEPREVCNDVQVTQQAPVKDEHRIAGTVIGGVLGAVVGNQIGSGKGRKIAKVAGAVGGAYAGNKVQEHMQNSDTVTTTEKKCETVNESHEVPNGYRVTYEWKGSTRTVHMDRKPGSRLPVRDGDVVLTAAR